MNLEGKKGSINVNAASYASPSWTRIPRVGNLKMMAEWDMIDAMDRDSDFKTFLVGFLDITVEFDLNYNHLDATHIQLRTDCLAGTVREYAVLNGPLTTSGSIGFRAEFLVKGFSVEMDLTSQQKVPIKLVPYAGWTNAPASYTI